MARRAQERTEPEEEPEEEQEEEQGELNEASLLKPAIWLIEKCGSPAVAERVFKAALAAVRALSDRE